MRGAVAGVVPISVLNQLACYDYYHYIYSWTPRMPSAAAAAATATAATTSPTLRQK